MLLYILQIQINIQIQVQINIHWKYPALNVRFSQNTKYDFNLNHQQEFIFRVLVFGVRNWHIL